jgi:hypothetical protein
MQADLRGKGVERTLDAWREPDSMRIICIGAVQSECSWLTDGKASVARRPFTSSAGLCVMYKCVCLNAIHTYMYV